MPAARPSSPFRIVHTVCSHDCPDSCAVLVTVNEEGRAIKVAGDPSQPVTNGFLCGKVAKYLDRVYSPERILYPLRRKPGVAKGLVPRGREYDEVRYLENPFDDYELGGFEATGVRGDWEKMWAKGREPF